MVKLIIDDKEIEAKEGATLLQVCLDNDIYIPNLCYIDGMESPQVSCRLCFVEIEGVKNPVTSCTVSVKDGMKVRTDTPDVRRLQKRAFQLLMSVHDVGCKECHAKKRCELRRIAKFLKIGLKPKELEHHLKPDEIADNHPFLIYYPNRCVLCAKCIRACQQKHGQPFLTFAKRGIDTVISFYGETEQAELPCKDHVACVEICPVGALGLKSELSASI